MYVYVHVYVHVHVCMYVGLCLREFRDLESGLSRKKSEDLQDGERSLRRAKSGETLAEDRSFTDVRIVRYASGIGVEDQSNNLAAGSLQKCTCVP